MTHTGWRKPTPGLVAAEQQARAGERSSISKTQAIVALKKVAAAIGLKAQDLLLIDTFGAITQSQDWEEGRRPVVWPSNNFLMEQTGFSLTTLRRHVRKLCDAGVIWMKDSPNGKRYGIRNKSGHIVEAYGFDLSPLAARTEEFEALYTRIQHNRKKCRSLRNSITITRRVIRSKIESALERGLEGHWSEMQGTYNELLKRLPKHTSDPGRLSKVLECLKRLLKAVDTNMQNILNRETISHADHETYPSDSGRDNDSMKTSETPPKGAGIGTRIQTTKQPNKVNSSHNENYGINIRIRNDPAELQIDKLEAAEQKGQISTDLPPQIHAIDVTTVITACPEFSDFAKNLACTILNFDGVHRAAAKIAPMLGIKENAWNAAQKELGSNATAAAIALIFDKYSAGEVSSPGGYLRGMIKKAKNDELNLEKSFYGRLRT